VSRGELLLGELNCVACHDAPQAVRQRLASRNAPVLGPAGSTVTPQFLRAWLEDPQRAKPGTPMPDLLGGLERSEKAEAIEALVHFLWSQPRSPQDSPVDADPFKMETGRRLYHEVGCVACHAPQEPAGGPRESAVGAGSAVGLVGAAGASPLAAFSIPLGPLATKYTVAALAEFLVDPLRARPGGRMPSLQLSQGEGTAIAMYLLREQAGLDNAARPPQRLPGLRYEYFESEFESPAPDFDRLTPVASGTVERFTTSPRRREQNIGLRFTGFLNVPADGRYTFYCRSDDGSRLYIGDRLVVQNDGVHPSTEQRGSIELKAGDHPVQVTWFQAGGEHSLRVSYEGPGLSKQEIPATALWHLGQPMTPLGEEKLVVDAAKAERGQRLFRSLGCAACHQIDAPLPTGAASSQAKPLLALEVSNPAGCLGEQPGQGTPRYALSQEQRQVLRETLANPASLQEPLPTAEAVSRTLAALNCFACHTRDGVGGPEPDRAAYFRVVGDADLGDEGRLPPHLTGVGRKLRADWLREVLVDATRVRPYMATRMPQFGAVNVAPLVRLFQQADSAPEEEPEAPVNARLAKFGHKLVGRDGLVCISCHTFGPFKSLGIPAMDLTQMARRLRKSWFRAYLLDPQSLRPGTRMPSFFPDGEAANRDILGGDTEQQIDALWAYLSQGREAEVPHGLIQARLELVPTTEPIVYRNFIKGAGPRAIAVGYPEGAHLAFDADAGRLALIWQGAFIDASMHRSDRSAGWAPPLGDHVRQLPPGPPFAVLPSRDTPWPEATGKAAGFRLLGYRLDAQRRPVFLYAFGALRIEDYPVPKPTELDPLFVRTLTVRAEQPVQGLWFRAAVGTRITPTSDGAFAVDDKMTLRFPSAGPGEALVRRNGEQAELLLPVKFANHTAQIVEEIIW
jgi:cytochrome c2